MYNCRKDLWGILPAETTGQNGQQDCKNIPAHLSLAVRIVKFDSHALSEGAFIHNSCYQEWCMHAVSMVLPIIF